VPGMALHMGVQVPCTGSANDQVQAKDKGVRREAESEGSLRHNSA